MREKIPHIGTGLDRERPAQFAVHGVLDDDIKNLDAVIDQNLKFFLRVFGGVPARQDSPMKNRGVFRQPVALGCRDDLVAAGAQDGYILDQTLAAHAETLGQFAAPDGHALLPQVFDNPPASLLGGIQVVAPGCFVP